MPTCIQPIAKGKDELLLGAPAQTSPPLLLDLGNAIRPISHHSTVVEIAGDDQPSASSASMAVHEDLLTHLFIETAHVLTDHEDEILLGTGQVLPVPIKSRDTVRLEALRIVTEADLVINAIATQ